MNLAELGSLISEKRQSKNLSIEDVAKAIKIPQQSLLSIEKGDLECIGYETYYKSFLKCYMQYLGYTFAEYQDMVNTVEGFSDETAVQKTLKPQYGDTEEKKAKPREKKLAVQLLILAILGGSAYFYFSQNDNFFGKDRADTPITAEKKSEQSDPSNPFAAKETEKNEIAAQSQLTADTEQNAASSEEGKNVQESKAAVQSDTQKNTENEQKSAANSNTQNEKEVKETAQNSSELVVQNVQEQKEENPADMEKFLKENPSAGVIDWTKVEAPQKGEQQAVMYAKQDCWMQYKQDDKSGHFIIRKGDQRVFNFKQSLYFRIANGSAITLFHNKKPVEVGDSTKVREVTLK